MRKIKLTQGKYALVDNEDYAFLIRIHWSLSSQKNTSYTIGVYEGKRVPMHRLIMGVHNKGGAIIVNHKNFNGLDNRKQNLELCTNSQNCFYKRMQNTKKYRGVYLMPMKNRIKRWSAQISKDAKHMTIGYFGTEKEAAIAWNKSALKLFGRFAILNKV